LGFYGNLNPLNASIIHRDELVLYSDIEYINRNWCLTMNDKDKQTLIQNYLAAADRVLQEEVHNLEDHQKNLEQDQVIFERVVEELGLSSEEQENLSTVAIEFLNTAQDYYFRKEYGQSIELGERAQQLLPYDVRPLELLLQIFSSSPHREGEKALQIAKRILAINPAHQQAREVVHSSSTSLVIPSKKPLMFGAVGMTAAVGVFFYLSSPSPEQMVISSSEVGQKIELNPPVEKTPLQETVKSQDPPSTIPLEHPPIDFSNVNLAGVEFSDRGSKFSAYKDSFSYQLSVLMLNNSKEEIKEIKGAVELLDAKGKVIVKKSATLRESFRAALRPGEGTSLDVLIYQDHYPENYQHPQFVRVSFDRIEHEPAPSNISKEAVSLQWEGEKLEQYSISVQRRKSNKNLGVYNGLMKEWNSINVYEFTNEGEGVIKLLKVKQAFIDERGELLKEAEHLITYSSKPYIAPGETRLDSYRFSTPQKASVVTLTVVEIE